MDIIFVDECSKCHNEYEDLDEKSVCKKCRNKCEICGKKAVYNFEDEDYGVKCRDHKLKTMVNLQEKKYVIKKFIKIIESMGGKVIGEYKTNHIPIECICKFGHTCFVRPSNIKKGDRGMCRVCAKQDPETSKINFFNNVKTQEGKVLGEYVNSNTKVKCICKLGHICFPLPTNIQQGHRMCILCSDKDNEIAETNFYTSITDKHKGKVIGKYTNNYTKVECICENGHICFPIPGNIQQGRGICITCINHDSELAKQEFFDRINDREGKVLGEYITNKIKVKCICPYGHICFPCPSKIQQGQGMCRKCVRSGGELFISAALENLNIPFEIEVNNPLLKKKLRFDFYFEYNSKRYYIEFDGEQHFKFVSLWHTTKENFLHQQQRDIIKNYIAKLSGIKMIRISYNEIKGVSMMKFQQHILNLINDNSDKMLLITDSLLYDNWIYKEPLEDINEYIC